MKKIITSILFMILLVGLISEAFLVSAVPTDKDSLDKITFIHYKDGKVKAIDHNAKDGTSSCYKLIGVKWHTTPTYMINPANSQGLIEDFITSAISTSAETWDSATSKELFNNQYITNYAAQYGIQNYQNAIVFGDYPNDNVIAVTSVWFTRVGKRIVEFDMLFNTRFNWGDATINSGLMDLQNIATHELGHSVGLADIYSTSCSAVTMYGYSWNGDTSKRDLEQPDIRGLQTLYGA